MLDGDVLVLQLAHLVLRRAEDLRELAAQARGLARTLEGRERVDGGRGGLADDAGLDPDAAQDGDGEAVGLLEQRGQERARGPACGLRRVPASAMAASRASRVRVVKRSAFMADLSLAH